MPTLVVLAAGMGSRFGGLKQLYPIGLQGETIIDYSVYDAVRAGFDKVVFVIRPEFEAEFRSVLLRKFESRVACRSVYQELHSGLCGRVVPDARSKPWGTGHAVLVAEPEVAEPFAVINADDFYGQRSFEMMARLLAEPDLQDYAMVGYSLRNTLSEHGSVSRGVCYYDGKGYLKEVVERTKVFRDGDAAFFVDDEGGKNLLTGDEIVSLNLWGFLPSFFAHLRKEFDGFIETLGSEPGSEFFLPAVVNRLVETKQVRTRVLTTPDKWFGITYQQDLEAVKEQVVQLTKAGVYPSSLW